jgi:hypothetical protein
VGLSHKHPAQTPCCLDIMVAFGIITVVFANKIFANMLNNISVYLHQHLAIAIGILLTNINLIVTDIQCKQLELLANSARIWEVTIRFRETNVRPKYAKIF